MIKYLMFLGAMFWFVVFAWCFTHGGKFEGLLYLMVSLWWWTCGILMKLEELKR